MRKERLQSFRVKRGYTQETLAAALQTDKRQITRWENGESIPGGEKLSQISRILNISTDYLLGLSDDPTPQVRVDNLTEEERAVLRAMRNGDDKEAIKIIANR
jgi:transcriptional regulator with XRE-family HTH domain